MKKTFLLGVMMAVLQPTHSQINLVPNAGFDTVTSCAAIGQSDTLSLAVPWFAGTNSPTGMHNACATDPGFSVPYSIGGVYQPARSGGGYALLGVYFSSLGSGRPGLREFLQVKLRDTLKAGRQYFLELYTNPMYETQPMATNVFIKNIGMAFSSKKNNIWNEYDQFPGIAPAIENRGGLITDTANWTRVSGCYTARGDEEYLLVGNFQRLENTRFQKVGTGVPYGAYYFFEDVVFMNSTHCQTRCTCARAKHVDLMPAFWMAATGGTPVIQIRFWKSQAAGSTRCRSRSGIVCSRTAFA